MTYNDHLLALIDQIQDSAKPEEENKVMEAIERDGYYEDEKVRIH